MSMGGDGVPYWIESRIQHINVCQDAERRTVNILLLGSESQVNDACHKYNTVIVKDDACARTICVSRRTIQRSRKKSGSTIKEHCT